MVTCSGGPGQIHSDERREGNTGRVVRISFLTVGHAPEKCHTVNLETRREMAFPVKQEPPLTILNQTRDVKIKTNVSVLMTRSPLRYFLTALSWTI